MTWTDIVTFLTLLAIAAISSAYTLLELRTADLRRWREATCGLHRWQRDKTGGIVCQRCHKRAG